MSRSYCIDNQSINCLKLLFILHYSSCLDWRKVDYRVEIDVPMMIKYSDHFNISETIV